MPRFGPISRRELIDGLRQLGFEGPFSGTGRHPSYMVKGTLRVKLPNPHQSDVGRQLLAQILKQAGVTRDEWEAV